jgi:hypothetical protein
MAEQTLHSLREGLPATGLSTFGEAGGLFSLATACPVLDTGAPGRQNGRPEKSRDVRLRDNFRSNFLGAISKKPLNKQVPKPIPGWEN